MARLGRRERHEKRERLERLKALARLRKQESQAEQARRDFLPRCERKWLTGDRPNYLEVHNGKSTTVAGKIHTQRAYVGRSDGSGKPIKTVMPERFATSFMAPGHEKVLLAFNGLRVPTNKEEVSFKKAGYVFKNGKKTKRVIWREVGKP